MLFGEEDKLLVKSLAPWWKLLSVSATKWHIVFQAAAAMCVGIGSFADPPKAQGLAHFLGMWSLYFLLHQSCPACSCKWKLSLFVVKWKVDLIRYHQLLNLNFNELPLYTLALFWCELILWFCRAHAFYGEFWISWWKWGSYSMHSFALPLCMATSVIGCTVNFLLVFRGDIVRITYFADFVNIKLFVWSFKLCLPEMWWQTWPQKMSYVAEIAQPLYRFV